MGTYPGSFQSEEVEVHVIVKQIRKDCEGRDIVHVEQELGCISQQGNNIHCGWLENTFHTFTLH